ncbi:type III secretion system export apparatus subunit SctT [Pandoraea oxalativorans]|uniref:EscT/YscT/HrcT family type III secretion system export apparatus protein n=1 Tax=Pandoraea oxalativorans TaxID=573737 RepID=A0A0G3ICF3_9BURK|nr:type III secretion system export apparatus subunit SctT [Pandoraea oxalativorans]AKK24869.1 EscT/YscT/HrcT family type III secretion system export apparatus protein [Pandoraea oxalativorans]
MDELVRWLPLIALAMVRPLGAMLLLPPLSSGVLGGMLVRNALALMATLPTLPLFASLSLPNGLTDPGAYLLLVASELTIGLLMGFSAAIPFWALDMAGFLLDTMRGASMAGVFNPLIGGQSSPLGGLFSQIAAALFMSLGGFHALMSALYASYTHLPPGASWHWAAGFLPMLEREWHTLQVLMLGFAMPAIVLMVLVDLALGLMNRSAQQMNVFSLSMPIKSVLTLLMLLLSLNAGLSDVVTRFDRFDGGLLRMLEVAP